MGTVLSQHFCYLIKFFLYSLLHFGLQHDKLSFTSSECITFPLKQEYFLCQDVICFEQLLLSIVKNRFCIFQVLTLQIKPFICFPLASYLFNYFDLLSLNQCNLLVELFDKDFTLDPEIFLFCSQHFFSLINT